MLPLKCHSGHVMEFHDEYNNCTKFQFYTEKKSSQIFHFLSFYINLSPSCDGTSHLICINQNLEQLGNQECNYNQINAILHHFESSFE